MTEIPPDRRAFLGAMAASPLLSGRQRSAPEDPPPIDAAVVAEAAKLLGLEFAEGERGRIATSATAARRSFLAIRKEPIPNALFPDGPGTTFEPPPWSDWVHPALPSDSPDRPSGDDALLALPAHAQARLVRDRKISSRELTAISLRKLAARDKDLRCVVNLLEERALEVALERDAETMTGWRRGPLHGLPYGLKDLFSVPGAPTTWGARPFRDQVIEEESEVYRLLTKAGAVLVAKLSLGALAMGDLWFRGRTRNPWNPEQGSSGSSAGSAAAVAARCLPFAIGTETLGSILSPCTRCGVSGLRPTFGRISRHGAMALSWSMDKVGPIARSAHDLALVFTALIGRDPRDPATRDAPFGFSPRERLEGTRIGYVPAEFQGDAAASDAQVLDDLRALGAETVPTEFPGTPAAPLRLILEVEAAAAFDELLRSGGLGELDGQGPGDWPDLFRAARFVPAVEYVQAQRLRRKLRAEWESFLSGFDAVVTATHRGGALLPTNLTGHPAVVMPDGFDGRRPRSITFLARAWGEGPLLEIASAWQESRDWHLREP